MTALLAKEAGACGTCMMVGVAIGLYRDLYEAKEYFVKEKDTYLPDPARAAAYAKYYRAYRSIYPSVRGIVKEAYDE